ncbi:MAG: flagellar basal body P-ring protein FlgI [Deltaproteobacteria bacterium]|nr:flagellar basal body P-ring protein FlgI [Deltaproteobacteria bacterium]
MQSIIEKIIIIVIMLVAFMVSSAQAIRIKDIAGFQGVRSNQLVGYGVVVGLDGTGDDDKTEFTFQSFASMMEKMGIVVDPEALKLDNVAGVMVTATLPPFSKVGSRIDVVVSSIGNAESLQGGTLLMTPLKAPNGEIYAVAQGAVSIGGFSFGGAAGGGIQKNHPTVGQIPSGAMVEREVEVNLADKSVLEISLYQPDFTTAMRMAASINTAIGTGFASALDAATVRITVPESDRSGMVAFMSKLEHLTITPDNIARVVMNERTGTVVMGEHVRISTVAISHGNLSIIIKEQPGVSQPMPFSQGQTVVVPQTNVQVQEQKANLILMTEGVNIGQVIRGLNAIGVTPRDLIAIIQSIKAAGALQAALEII